MSEDKKKSTEEEIKVGSWHQESARMLNKNRKNLLIVGAAAVVLLGIGILLGTLIGKNSSAGQGVSEGTVAETQTEETTQAAVTDSPLEVNAHPEINDLFRKYYQAAAVGDVDTINTLKDYSEQTELIQIQEKSKYLEGYEDINCYTKPGPEEGSYVVYVSYYARFREMEKAVVGLNTYVVCQNESGEYYIHDCSQDEVMKEYRINVTKQDDVVDLFNRVQVEYNEAVTEDEELATFLTELSDALKASVGEAIAETEAASAQTEEDASTTEEEPEEQPAVSKVEATDVVNIRKSDSETADRIGKSQVGEQFTLLESRGNGWSKIEYQGQEAYMKSEYLIPVEAEEDTADEAEGGNAAEGQEPADNEDTSSGVPNSGTYRLTTTVNIRKSASETADRLGVGYSGDVVEILMKQADGWTKVKFKGETGYIKTDILK